MGELPIWIIEEFDRAKRLDKELATLKTRNEALEKALQDIAEGCSFPDNEVQKAIRDRARDALTQARTLGLVEEKP